MQQEGTKNTELLKIAVFDLNQTVFHLSSKDDFFKFIAGKNPKKALDIFQLGFYSLLDELNLISKTTFKENFFHYLDGMDPATVKAYAKEYWSQAWPEEFNTKLLGKIEELRQQGIKIYFITGTLDVYVAPLFEHYLKPDAWMATRTQYINGRYKVIGKACKNEEKIRRLQQFVKPRAYEITEAYSDKEEAILQEARKAYLVQDKEITLLSAT